MQRLLAVVILLGSYEVFAQSVSPQVVATAGDFLPLVGLVTDHFFPSMLAHVCDVFPTE